MIRLLPLTGYLLLTAGVALALWRGDTARQALCAQRDSLDEQIAATEQLLAKYPRGPVFGISRKVIVDSQRRNRSTRLDLRILDC